MPPQHPWLSSQEESLAQKRERLAMEVFRGLMPKTLPNFSRESVTTAKDAADVAFNYADAFIKRMQQS